MSRRGRSEGAVPALAATVPAVSVPAMLVRLAPVLTAALFACAAGRASAALPLTVRAAVEYDRREWQTFEGREDLSGFTVPVDLLWRPDRATRVAAGTDLAWFDAGTLEGDGQIAGARQLRLGIDRSFARGRARIGAGLEGALGGDGLGVADGRLSDAFTEAALDLPVGLIAGGVRTALQGAVQVWQGRGLGVQAGAFWERRGEYEVIDDGRSLDPGDAWGLALSVAAEPERSRHELRLRLRREGESRLEGSDPFETGDLVSLRGTSRWSTAAWTLSGGVALAARASGAVAEGSALDPRALRGGNVARVTAGISRAIREAELGFSLTGAATRGFHGDLGHATWVEPSVFWLRRWSGGEVRLSLGQIAGAARDDRDLDGTRAAITWTGRAGS